ncbi:MAG: sugar porter family MFS transporter, partial [Acidobacteriaceae bacterium]|nr:sugar porter family MFS transporter [Acidobacteriaceae bacterium]
SALLFVISSVGTGLAGTFAVFLSWRILGGVAIGLASNLSPLYIAEVAPAFLRGQLVSLNQMAIVLGLVGAQVANWLIAQPVPAGSSAAQILASWNGQTGWRWMFAATAVPSFLFFVCTFAVPESPRWLVKIGQTERAERVLARIGGTGFAEDQLREIQETITSAAERANWTELLQRKLLRILALGIFLAVFQQWCGINVVFNYAQEIFAAAGYQVSDILFNIVVTGATTFVFTFVAIFLVDRLGRRPLMLAGAIGLALAYMMLGFSYYFGLRGTVVLATVVIAVGCYSFSLAPLTWVVLSEIFPNRIRGTALAIAVFALWAACFVLTYTFPFLNKGLGSAGTFWIYGGVCMVGSLVIWRKLPETKNKTLEQIERELVD